MGLKMPPATRPPRPVTTEKAPTAAPSPVGQTPPPAARTDAFIQLVLANPGVQPRQAVNVEQLVNQVLDLMAQGFEVEFCWDIDRVLVDNRARFLCIGQLFDAAQQTTYFQSCSAMELGHSFEDVMQRVDEAHREAFHAFAFGEEGLFWKAELFASDAPKPEVVELARRLYELVPVVRQRFVTGRREDPEGARKEATVRQLAEQLGLPVTEGDVVLKPATGVSTAVFKTDNVAAHRREGVYQIVLTEEPDILAAIEGSLRGTPEAHPRSRDLRHAPVLCVLLLLPEAGLPVERVSDDVWRLSC